MNYTNAALVGIYFNSDKHVSNCMAQFLSCLVMANTEVDSINYFSSASFSLEFYSVCLAPTTTPKNSYLLLQLRSGHIDVLFLI